MSLYTLTYDDIYKVEIKEGFIEYSGSRMYGMFIGVWKGSEDGSSVNPATVEEIKYTQSNFFEKEVLESSKYFSNLSKNLFEYNGIEVEDGIYYFKNRLLHRYGEFPAIIRTSESSPERCIEYYKEGKKYNPVVKFYKGLNCGNGKCEASKSLDVSEFYEKK